MSKRKNTALHPTPDISGEGLAVKQDNIPIPVFKSQVITELASSIGVVAHRLNTERNTAAREIAILCSRVKLDKEVWKNDGFTGIGDFGKKVFGIAASTLSGWISVANKFYLSEDFKDDSIIAAIPISNLVEIVKLPNEKIHTLINDGIITAESTQSQLREVENTFSEEEPDKKRKSASEVVKTYTGTLFTTCIPYTEDDTADMDKAVVSAIAFEKYTPGEIIELLRKNVDISIDDISLKGKDVKNASVVSISEAAIRHGVVVCSVDVPVKPSKKTGNGSVTITEAEYRALIEKAKAQDNTPNDEND